ncbi:MAG: hypothetical protein CHACPFDD_02845 [Phycisphaerae bacterium]|nr:hypothetical protein [Phycisphaerae bacterium]
MGAYPTSPWAAFLRSSLVRESFLVPRPRESLPASATRLPI